MSRQADSFRTRQSGVSLGYDDRMGWHLLQCVGKTNGVHTESAWQWTSPLACDSADQRTNRNGFRSRPPDTHLHLDNHRVYLRPAVRALWDWIGRRNVCIWNHVHCSPISRTRFRREGSVIHVVRTWRAVRFSTASRVQGRPLWAESASAVEGRVFFLDASGVETIAPSELRPVVPIPAAHTHRPLPAPPLGPSATMPSSSSSSRLYPCPV